MILLALAACGGRAPEPQAPGRTADAMGLLAAVERATCPRGLYWCRAARGWAGGRPGELAEGVHVLVGLTIGLEEGAPVEPALEQVTVSVLVWRKRGDAIVGRITELEPASDEEKLETSEARMRLESVLDGRSESAPLPPKLAEDLLTFPNQARYAMIPGEGGWILRGQALAEIRRVGPIWVVVEVPPRGPRGVFLSVFTDRWTRAE